MLNINDRIITMTKLYRFDNQMAYANPIPLGTVGIIRAVSGISNKIYTIELDDGYKYLYTYKKNIRKI